MKTFKTPKGLELPVSNIKGKDYLMVVWRIVWARTEYPNWSYETEIISHTTERSVVKATIRDDTGKILATAHKQEDQKGFPDNHLEKAETSAIGRALAMIGFGTQWAPELEEGERLADSPVQPPKQPINEPRANKPPLESDPPLSNLERRKIIGLTKITWGKKYRDRMIGQISDWELADYLAFLTKDGEPTNETVKKVARQIEEYLSLGE